MSEKQKLLNTLFENPDRVLLNFSFTKGPGCVSTEDLCREINSAISQIDRGLAASCFGDESRSVVNVRDLAASLA